MDIDNLLSVQRLLNKFNEKFDAENPLADILNLEAGMKQCHVFAVALGEASKQPYSISIAVRNSMNKHGEVKGRSFAHAVVNINGQNYDSGGSNAIELFEALFHPDTIAAIRPENDGSYSTFDWIEITESPSIDKVIDFIKGEDLECDEPSEAMVNYLQEIFSASLAPKPPAP